MRIWFNHWFSTVYHVFGLLRNYDSDVEIVASNVRENTLIKSGADEWFLEPLMGENEKYVDYCLETCKKYKIDVFIPRRGRNIISEYLDKFEEIGVKVLVNKDSEINNILDNKLDTYKVLKEHPELKKIVPYYLVVRDSDSFKSACVLVRYFIESTNCDRICIKNAVDEGGTSFKVLLDDKKASQEEKLEYNAISEKEMEKIIDKDVSKKTMLVMPYLTDEVSCDVLRTSKGVIVVTRKKVEYHTYLVKEDKDLKEYCTKLVKEFNINGPCNIQFRKIDDKWKLLDINNRMSGGIQISSLGSGVNIPLIALNQLMGKDDSNWEYSEDYLKDGAKVCNIETPILSTRK